MQKTEERQILWIEFIVRKANNLVDRFLTTTFRVII